MTGIERTTLPRFECTPQKGAKAAQTQMQATSNRTRTRSPDLSMQVHLSETMIERWAKQMHRTRNVCWVRENVVFFWPVIRQNASLA